MHKKFLIIVSIISFIFLIVIFSKNTPNNIDVNAQKNVEIIDNIQYITVNAKGGYFPKVSIAQANIPTKLIVKTNNTFDCSLALVINEINYKKILAQTGEEVIDLGTPDAGKIQGLCSMGMYNFQINFN